MIIEYKKATTQHVNFIHNSWLHSAHLSGIAANDLVRLIPKLLPHTLVASVTLDGSESLVGWICAITAPANCVVYAYVKEPFRRTGVLSCLLAEAFGDDPGIIQYSYDGGKLTRLLASKYRMIHNPFFLLGRV
jgi:hypothetical protein